MIDIKKDILSVDVHCRFARPEQLVELLHFRLRHFVELIERVGEQSGNQVLWTNQHGGKVLKANVDLSEAGCQALAQQVADNEEFDFFAWTPWGDEIYPSVNFGRMQLLGKDKTHINFKFSKFYYIQDLDLKKIIDDLLGFERQKDIGFVATTYLLGNTLEEDDSGYESFNIYHHSNQGQFQNMGVEDEVNPDLPEDVFVDPRDLAAEWLPKLRKADEA